MQDTARTQDRTQPHPCHCRYCHSTHRPGLTGHPFIPRLINFLHRHPPLHPHLLPKHKQICAIAHRESSHAQSSYQMDHGCDYTTERDRGRQTFGLKAQTTKDTRIYATTTVFICRSRASARAPVSRVVTVRGPSAASATRTAPGAC